MPTTNHVADLIPLYALGATTGADCAAIEAHIQTCADCRALLREAQAVISALPAAIESFAPSSLLKSLLLTRVDKT